MQQVNLEHNRFNVRIDTAITRGNNNESSLTNLLYSFSNIEAELATLQRTVRTIYADSLLLTSDDHAYYFRNSNNGITSQRP